MAKKTLNKKVLKNSNSDLISLRKKLLNFRFKKANSQIENTSENKKIRKNIARLLTEKNKRKEESNA